MKLLTLGLSPSASCYLLKIEGTRVLLDCALEPGPFPADAAELGVAPELQKPTDDPAGLCPDYLLDTPQLHAVADWAAVDCILISNYHNLLALPYVTEYTAFRGKVYATDPSIQIGRQLMEEILSASEEPQSAYASRRPSDRTPAPKRRRSAEDPPEPSPSSRRAPYTLRDVESCLARIQPLSFKQEVELSPTLRAMPCSSGFCIGGAYWTLRTATDKIVYLAACSSTVSRHPEPLDMDNLRGADVLIASEVAAEGAPRPDAMLAELLAVLGAAVREGGSLLLPCYPSGILLDLLEQFHACLQQLGARDVPLYLVSPSADVALAYADVASEWLCRAKQDRVLLAEYPFLHTDLARAGALAIFPDPATRPSATAKHGTCGSGDAPPLGRSYREPCVVFAGPPSLRGGAALRFVRAWAHRPECAVALVDPSWDPQACRAPFARLALRSYCTPLDLRLTPQEVSRVLHEARPRQALVPAHAAGGLQAPEGCTVSTLTHLSRRHVPLQAKYREAALDARAAATVRTVRVPAAGGAEAARLCTTFSSAKGPLQSGRHVLPPPPPLFCGTVSAQRLVAALREEGYEEIEELEAGSSDGPGARVLWIGELQARVTLKATETRVEAAGPAAREALAALVQRQLLRL